MPLASFINHVRNDLGYSSNRPYIWLNHVTKASQDYNLMIGAPDEFTGVCDASIAGNFLRNLERPHGTRNVLKF